ARAGRASGRTRTTRRQGGMQGAGAGSDSGSAMQLSRLAAAAARVRGDIPLVVLDACIVAGAYFILFVFRFDLSLPDRYWHKFLIFVSWAVLVSLVSTGLWGAYGRTWQHAGVDEARRVAMAAASSAVVLIPLFGFGNPRVPLLVLFVGPFVIMVLQGLVR